MGPLRLSRLWELVAHAPPLVLGLWVGLAAITVAVLVLRHSRWGQSHPLRKCLFLSLLAHLLLVGYATTVPVVFSPLSGAGEATVLVTVDEERESTPVAEEPPEPSSAPPADVAAAPPVKEPIAPPEPVAPPQEPSEFAATTDEPEAIPQRLPEDATQAAERLPSPARVPAPYQLRMAANRGVEGQKRGATESSEQAVQAALRWLASHQAPSGAWIASQFGAGHEQRILGRDRGGAGAGADTGMTGLALLAFLAAGHTTQSGDYRDNVARGLQFLLASQGADGNLAGGASDFAAMYCHAMATLALSEAAGMTADPQLREPVRRALDYTLGMQNPTTGGWRYHRGDDGDTSQLGWQLMALKSGQLLGLPIPESAWQGARRYLRTVSSGMHGGLAAYRPGQRPSFAMTAEALLCRQLLGLSADSATASEAADHLLRELPGQSEPANLYYWYYGTMALYQLQGPQWPEWNAALQQTLLARQCSEGPDAGSWDTNTLWGGYGGRVYTTAIATLSLKVYYRYLPLLGREPQRAAAVAQRPSP